MNPRYRETAQRHRVLFALIILLCAFLGLSQALGTPKLYRSNATLSFPSLDSGAQFGATPPAAQAQEMLTELLATRAFPQTVAARSPLGAYLKNHNPTGSGPITMLKRLLKGSPSYDERIATALSPKRVTSMPSGSELLSVSFEAPTPVLAQKTLAVLLTHFLDERRSLQGAALSAANKQVSTARAQLKDAAAELSTYARSHPASTLQADPELKALTNAQLQAASQVKAAAAAVASATVNLGNSGAMTAGIIDHANLPAGPTTGKKRVGELTIVGAFVGGLISFGLIALMSRGNREEPPSVRPVELHEASPNGNGGAPGHEPDHEVLTGEPGSGEQIRRE